MIGIFLRYNFVQISAYVFDFGVFWILTNLAAINPAVLILFLPSSIAKIASDVICLGITFSLVHTTVFRNSSSQTKS